MQGVYAVGNFQPSEDCSRSRQPAPILREPPLSSLPNVSQSAIGNSHQGKAVPATLNYRLRHPDTSISNIVSRKNVLNNCFWSERLSGSAQSQQVWSSVWKYW